jgi:acid phosphatase family membrane protein YuiD
MFGGMFYSCALSSRQHGPEQAQSRTAFTVAGTPVPAEIVSQGVDAQLQGQMRQFGAMADMLGPTFEAGTYARVLNGLIDQAAYLPLAKKNGVDLGDAALLKAAERQLDEEAAAQREQAEMTGQLKKGATDKDWDDFLKKNVGKTFAEIRQMRLDGVRKALADASQRDSAMISLARPALEQQLASKMNVSDEQLRKSFENVTYKRVLLKTGVPGKTPDERAQAALKEIQGGLKFETAIDRYSNELPTPGKKLSETTNTASGSALATDPQFKALADLKAGQVSGVVDVPEGKAIYKVVSRTPNVPKDFETKKEDYRRKAVADLVKADVDRQLKELKASGNLVQFSAPGYRALYEYSLMTGDNPMAPVADLAKAQQIYNQAKQAVQKNEGYDARAAALAQYAALDSMYNAAGSNKESLRQARIDTTLALLETSESHKLRMDLVELYVEAKQNQPAAEQLLTAARNNTSFDETGQRRSQEIGAKRQELKSKGILSAEQERMILDEERRWQKDKAETDRLAAEQKRMEEELRKQAEAEAKKNAATKPGTTPAPGTTTTGATAPSTTSTVPLPGAPTPGNGK